MNSFRSEREMIKYKELWLGFYPIYDDILYYLKLNFHRLPPVMAFSIIVGLGLDYDVFLVSRVLEFRLHGYTNHSKRIVQNWAYHNSSRDYHGCGLLWIVNKAHRSY